MVIFFLPSLKILFRFFHFINSEEEGKKGHHDKENHEGEYEEKKGHKKKHHDESGWDFDYFQ